jgi:hypothetical protein
MLLLTDRTLEIPLFLLRNSDGSFTHPDVAVPMFPEFTVTVMEGPEILPRLTEHDKRVIAAIEREQTNSSHEHKTMKNEERKIAKQAEKERMLTNKMAARKEFVKHFKWDWEQ